MARGSPMTLEELFTAVDLAQRTIGDAGPSFADLLAAGFDPFDNVQRGLLVQALVAHTLGGRLTPGWHEYDIDLRDGTRVEVKSTATVQRWPPGARGYRASWTLPVRRGWNSDTNITRPEAGRWADTYVLHLLAADACEIEQWCDPLRHRFFVLSKSTVDDLQPAKSVTLSVPRARTLADELGISELRAAVEALPNA